MGNDKMRLIRITDADADGRFDGTINADLVIEKGSKICLESLALTLDDSKIQIPAGRGDISYSQNGFAYNVDVAREAPYSTGAGNELLDVITEGLNLAANYYPENPDPQQEATIGIEFRAAVNNTGKVAFQAYKGMVGELAKSNWEYSTNINVPNVAPPGQIAWGVNVALADGESRPAQIQFPIPRGSAYLEATINRAVSSGVATNPDRNGVWLCYTKEDLSALPVEQLRAALETGPGRTTYANYGVGITILAGNQVQALSIKNGVATPLGIPTTTAVGDGDIKNPRIRLSRANGLVIASSWNLDVPVAFNDAIDPVDADADLYQFVVFWDRDTYIKISQVQACISPYATDTLPSYVDEPNADLGVGSGVAIKPTYDPPQGIDITYNKYQPNYSRTNNFLDLADPDVSTFLGFRSSRIPVSGTRSSINFIANAAYRYGPRLLSDSIIVLSESVPIVSYDSTIIDGDGDGQQRSILGVVPVSSANLGSVSYQGREIFLDIRNNQPMTLRNLKFRLVDGEYLPLDVIGQASIVILVKGPDE